MVDEHPEPQQGPVDPSPGSDGRQQENAETSLDQPSG